MWQFNRLTSWLALLVLTAPTSAVFARPESVEVTFDYVIKKAEERAHKRFRSPRLDLPSVLRADKLDYDKYREIEFRHENALWSTENIPFRVEFFHPGYLYQEPVRIHEFTLTHMQQIRFAQDFFNYRNLRIKQIPADTGYAGFRLLCRLNETNRWDELGAFLGMSYFRLLGKGQRYGESARGLALDCGELDRSEEFPIFTDWWLGKPHADDDSIRLYAILDSVSCAGAYAFLLRPGETTVADVDAVLFFREDKLVTRANPQRQPLATIGLAPLTTMFWYGENSERKFDDYRPEVHDSDGLLIRLDNGEVLWRPLNNASVTRHQRFATRNVRGFGLLQRDRNFASYQDIFNFYHLVPSVWVEPHGNWGEGEVHLVELSTTYEGSDNVVAFWSPKVLPQPLQPYRFSYTLYWTRETDMKLSPSGLAQVTATRSGMDPRNSKRRQIVIDFSSTKLAGFKKENPPVAIASCSDNAAVVENQVFHNATDNSWRVVLKLEPQTNNTHPVDIRCTLMDGEEVLSETWTYHWSPP